MAFTFPQLIRNSWGLYLFIGLSGLIIARLIEMVMGYKQKSKYSRIMSYVSIVIFSLYIMYDTKKIIVNADNCVNPDYINESINLFLDTLNLFQTNYMLSSR